MIAAHRYSSHRALVAAAAVQLLGHVDSARADDARARNRSISLVEMQTPLLPHRTQKVKTCSPPPRTNINHAAVAFDVGEVGGG